MKPLRTRVIESVATYLEAQGCAMPVHREVDTSTVTPPYALVRVGSSTPLAPGQCDIEEFLVYVAAIQDADVTTADAAEEAAGALFALMDTDYIAHAASHGVLVSTIEGLTTEVTIASGLWQHFAHIRILAGNTAPP